MPNSEAPDGLRPCAHPGAELERSTPVFFEPIDDWVQANGAPASGAAPPAAQAALAQAGRMATLAEMSATIAHEINQPLAAIVMGAETGLRWLKRDEPDIAKVEQLLKRIVSNARRANDIVQRIRGMAAKQEPELVPIDLNDAVEEALLFVRPELESRSVKLSAKLGRALPGVLGDRVQLQQVVVNLVLNSIHAIAQAESVARRITLSTRAEEDDAIGFSIHDSGPGIPDENLERVFDSFFTTKDGGMGIGLAICRSIIAAHCGSITVSNRPGGGAQFQFTLPAMPGARRRAQRSAAR